MKIQKGKYGLSCLYSNVDQLLNKIEDLRMMIASSEPDIIMLTEVIPKAQKNPILETQIKLNGYDVHKNFEYTDENLGSSGIRGVVIYVKENLKCKQVKLSSEFDDHVSVEISLRNDEQFVLCLYIPKPN